MSTRFSISGAGGVQGLGQRDSTREKSTGRTVNTNADELHVENERLKTTLTILSQKIKLKEDDSNVLIEKLKTEITKLESKNKLEMSNQEQLKSEIKQMKN